MTEETRGFCWHQNFGGCLPLTCSYIDFLNHEKMCIKSEVEEMFLKFATTDLSDEAFLLTSKFWPKYGLSATAQGLYTFTKTWKVCIQSEGRAIFWNMQLVTKVIRPSVSIQKQGISLKNDKWRRLNRKCFFFFFFFFFFLIFQLPIILSIFRRVIDWN